MHTLLKRPERDQKFSVSPRDGDWTFELRVQKRSDPRRGSGAQKADRRRRIKVHLQRLSVHTATIRVPE